MILSPLRRRATTRPRKPERILKKNLFPFSHFPYAHIPVYSIRYPTGGKLRTATTRIQPRPCTITHPVYLHPTHPPSMSVFRYGVSRPRGDCDGDAADDRLLHVHVRRRNNNFGRLYTTI